MGNEMINCMFSYPCEPKLCTKRGLQTLGLFSYVIIEQLSILYTTNVKNIIQYIQMCCGGHIGFEGMQRYASPSSIAWQLCPSFGYGFFFFIILLNLPGQRGRGC